MTYDMSQPNSDRRHEKDLDKETPLGNYYLCHRFDRFSIFYPGQIRFWCACNKNIEYSGEVLI